MFHMKHSESRKGVRPLPPAGPDAPRYTPPSQRSDPGTQNAPGSLSLVDEASD